MKSLSRREWFKRSLATGTGLLAGAAAYDALLAGPVSRAEAAWQAERGQNQKMVRLGSNENPYGPSPKVRQAIAGAMNAFNRYSHDAVADFKKILAEKEGVSPDHILVVNGSAETLCLACMATGLEGGAVLSAFPTFRSLMEYAEKLNSRWDRVDLDEYHVHNLEALAAAVKPDTRMVFVCNPNNPTGTVVDAPRLRDFCVEMSKKTTVLADEAYLEFLEPHEQQSMVTLVQQGHNVMVSRTFSKVAALAGLRIGYCIAQPDTIKKLQKFQMGPVINQAALAAARAALTDSDFAALTRKKNNEALKFFLGYLDSKKWFHGASRANCVLFPAPKDGKTILAETEKRGFQIRVWDYQSREWCRVSIGTLDEMKAFTRVFDEVTA
jgi:histidinol-phosphate aminotransferase